MKKLIIIIILIGLGCALVAETSGECGFQMLKIVSGASMAAQGGAGAFSATDAFPFLQNPAAGVINRTHVISMTQNYWLFDTTLNCLAYTNFLGKTAFGLSYRYLDYGKIDSYDDTGENIGEFHPIDLTFSTNFAFRITPDHFVGLNINALYEKIDTSSSFGFSFDVGYVYITPIKDLKLAAAIKHFGKTSEMDKEDIDLPVTGEIAAVKDFNINLIKISSEIKAIKHIDDDVIKAVIGLNIIPIEKLTLRFGYKINYDLGNISLGLGINLKKINIDYAYIPSDPDYEINDVHMIGISYKF